MLLSQILTFPSFSQILSPKKFTNWSHFMNKYRKQNQNQLLNNIIVLEQCSVDNAKYQPLVNSKGDLFVFHTCIGNDEFEPHFYGLTKDFTPLFDNGNSVDKAFSSTTIKLQLTKMAILVNFQNKTE